MEVHHLSFITIFNIAVSPSSKNSRENNRREESLVSQNRDHRTMFRPGNLRIWTTKSHMVPHLILHAVVEPNEGILNQTNRVDSLSLNGLHIGQHNDGDWVFGSTR